MSEIQIASHTYDVSHSVASAEEFAAHFLGLIEKSLKAGARVVVFPEYACYALAKVPGFSTPEAISEFVWKQFYPRVVELSARYKALICAGTAPYVGYHPHGAPVAATAGPQRDKTTNRALLAASGQEILVEKRCLTPWETDFVAGPATPVFEWDGLRVATLICFDCEFPEIGVELKRQDPHLVLVPSATSDRLGVERVCRTASARAVELGAVVVVSALVGKDEKNPMVDVNMGRCAVYLPAQEAFRGEFARESGMLDSGFHALPCDLERSKLLNVKAPDSETKPFLKKLH